MKRRQAKQLELTLRTWGGKRAGAGRKPKGPKPLLPHEPRPRLASRYPVHVTLKVRVELRSLRTKDKMRVIRQAFCAACVRDGFRIIDWSVQGDHIHMVVEAAGNEALSRGVQGFSIRVAKGLNELTGRKGSVFVDRFHAHILRTPREVRNCLAYVLLNARHHGVALSKGQADPCSSWRSFDGWRVAPPGTDERGPPSAAPPATWLRRVGWRRHGLIRLDETPGSAP